MSLDDLRDGDFETPSEIIRQQVSARIKQYAKLTGRSNVIEILYKKHFKDGNGNQLTLTCAINNDIKVDEFGCTRIKTFDEEARTWLNIVHPRFIDKNETEKSKQIVSGIEVGEPVELDEAVRIYRYENGTKFKYENINELTVNKDGTHMLKLKTNDGEKIVMSVPSGWMCISILNANKDNDII